MSGTEEQQQPPEHPFPAAVEDVDIATHFILTGGLGEKADLSHVVVLGESAGGNLAAVASMMARDRQIMCKTD